MNIVSKSLWRKMSSPLGAYHSVSGSYGRFVFRVSEVFPTGFQSGWRSVQPIDSKKGFSFTPTTSLAFAVGCSVDLCCSDWVRGNLTFILILSSLTAKGYE